MIERDLRMIERLDKEQPRNIWKACKRNAYRNKQSKDKRKARQPKDLTNVFCSRSRSQK